MTPSGVPLALSLKELACGLCPPLLWGLLSRTREGAREDHLTFSGVYPNFASVLDQHPWTSAAYLESSRYELRHHEQSAASASATSAQVLLAYVINSLPAGRTPRILDWAGGTGLRYWTVRPGLNRPVHWHVVDNALLAAIGREIMGGADQLSFSEDMPAPSAVFDIILIYASLQYSEDQAALLKALARYQPKYIVLARLMALRDDSYVTRQTIHRLPTPCKVSSLQDIAGALGPEGYAPVLMSQDGRDLTPLFHDDIPSHRRVGKEWLVVFRSGGGPS